MLMVELKPLEIERGFGALALQQWGAKGKISGGQEYSTPV
jgi:hypothetical protein